MKNLIDIGLLKRNRNFRLLYLGQCVSFFGTMITSVALPYQIYQQTHSTLMVGLLSLAQLLPLLLTALLGGVLQIVTIAAAFGITASIVSGGVLCVLAVGICCYYLPRFRSYRSS